MESQERRVHVRIEGRVQGVGYRAWTSATAKKLGLRGWVRNRIDGWVEAVFVGTNEAVEMMLQDCYDGPPAAQVKSIEVKDYDGDPGEEFWAKPTV